MNLQNNLKPFIDGYIWDIHQFPRCGVHYNYYPISDIYYYNSLKDRTFSRENKIAVVQVPEEQIHNLKIGIFDIPQISKTPISVGEFVHKHKDVIIKNKYPIIRKQIINDIESWICDLNMLFFDLERKWNV
jgi:hypothetical protein